MYFAASPLEDQGCEFESVGLAAVPAAADAASLAASPPAGLAGVAGGAGALRLCFCASGITSGPF
ncbi:MAG: hypothetical protein ACLPV8_14640 [Steroidobacteraceae bacterium]